MAYKIIRPRHGIKSLWDRYKSRIYKLGEMLVESPESGVGSGPVNIKFGDGVTDYESLPYAVLAPVKEVSEGVDNPPTSDAVKKALSNVNVEVVDNLESTSTKLALSANQGKILNGCLETLNNNMIKYNSETDSLDIYENGVVVGSVKQLGIKSTIKYYTHSSSGSTRTLTLSENWAAVSSFKVISGPCAGEKLTWNFVAPKTINYSFSNSTGITSGSYSNVFAIEGKLA